MKKLVTALAFACTASTAVMAETDVPAITVTGFNSNPETTLCLAAAESREALAEAKSESVLNPMEIRTVQCNGRSLDSFTAYMAVFKQTMATPVVMTPADESSLTSLCIAAAISEEALAEASMEMEAEGLLTEEVMCNNKPLKRFAAEYERRAVTSAF